MKRVILLSLAIIAAPVLAGEPVPLSFEARVSLAKAAEDDERFHPYPSRIFRKAGRHLARTMRHCWKLSTKQDAKPFVLVADIHADGYARNVEVKPAHAAAKCFAAGFSSISYLPPPPYAGRDGFPVTMRVSAGR